MTTVKYNVPSISCGHCVNTIQMEVGDLEGVASVVASNETKEVEVQFDTPASEDKIVALLKEINYPPTE
ncbi:MAG TPA: heavy-metal-associated domain-containing protein [Anaerolineales bacterium]|nr:heavy-metal-associated domain-containing protein [Anaerolineales bacterium]